MILHLTGNEVHTTSTEVRIPCGTVTLPGALVIPPGANGVVVFAHGSGSSRHSPRNQLVARVIRKSGNGTLLFDLLTAEEEIQDNVTGRLRFDIAMLARRLAEVTRWLNAQAVVKNLGIGYFGSSTGSAAALIAAAESGEQIDAIVSRGGRPDLAGDALRRVQPPTLFIVGGYDYPVLQLNQQAFGEIRCQKQLRIIPGATHLFQESGALEAVACLAADWFRQYLHKSHTPDERH